MGEMGSGNGTGTTAINHVKVTVSHHCGAWPLPVALRCLDDPFA
jgi:hypothetical protein